MDEAADREGSRAAEAIALAKRDDFLIGNDKVSPSLRTVEGPLGRAKGEPRVIQVLVALADARGRVLSRDDLLRLCWESRIVGDDAINRSVAEVRRIAAATGAGFEVETVPRIGYRLVGVDWDNEPAPIQPDPTRRKLSRRAVLAGSGFALTALAGGAAAISYSRQDLQTDALIERGRLLQGSGSPDADRRAAALFRQATQRDPERAEAWGWLALVESDDAKARDAAYRAVELDPREPNARTLLAFQRRDLESWTRWEDALLGVVNDHPDCAAALAHLTFFYQGMGRCRDSLVMNERVIAVEPFNPGHQSRRALKHWIFGRVGEADKVAERALQLWPRHSAVWNARLIIFAFTERAPAALALLDDATVRPPSLTEPSQQSWRAMLTAIATRSTSDIDRAVRAGTAAATLAPGLAANAIMAFAHLGELDAAFEVASGLLENRGTVVQRSRGPGIRDLYSGSSWGRTQFLFIPACSALRADARFPELCRRVGHVDYWRRRGIWPDPFVRGAVDPAALA